MSDYCVRLSLPSDPRYLALVRAAVGEFGSIHGLPDEDCRGTVLAVDEAMANIIRHAYKGESGRPIEVTCRAAAGHLEFTLFDQGKTPDPERIAPHPLDGEALGGRGTHIIRSIMDDVRYERVTGGNRLRLLKRLPAALGAGDGEEKGI